MGNEPTTYGEHESQDSGKAWSTPRLEPLGAVPVEGATAPNPTETGFGTFGPIS